MLRVANKPVVILFKEILSVLRNALRMNSVEKGGKAIIQGHNYIPKVYDKDATLR